MFNYSLRECGCENCEGQCDYYKNAKNKTKKEVKGKDKHDTDESMGVVQGDNQTEAREHVLYMWGIEPHRLELAYRTHVGKGFTIRTYEIRPAGTSSPVLQLQYEFRRNGVRLLQKNVKGNRRGKNGRAGKR